MVMKIYQRSDGQWEISQSLVPPVVYLDHWAVRMYSSNLSLQNEFLHVLKSKAGTLLFSQNNLNEFCVMTDLKQATSVEQFINRALPHFFIADFTQDPHFRSPKQSNEGTDAPPMHWLLQFMAEYSSVNGGYLSANRLVEDVVKHRAQLEPSFRSLKSTVVGRINQIRADLGSLQLAKKFCPTEDMATVDILQTECIRDVHLNSQAKFEENDVIDLVHAVHAGPVADFLLLDARWCDKLMKAKQRMISFGMNRHVARVYSKKTVERFMQDFEAWKAA
jgi:hypothetical protein